MMNITSTQNEEEDYLVPSAKSEWEIFGTHEKFSERLTQIECNTYSKYSILRETKDFSKQTSLLNVLQSASKLPSICWGNKKGEMEFNGVPYIWLGNCDYQCHQGPDKDCRKKEKYHLAQQEKLMNSPHTKPAKKRKLPPQSKKVGCPVKFHVKKIVKFPDYEIPTDTKWQRTITSKELKDELNKCKNDQECSVRHKLVFLTKFPKGGHQYHECGETTSIISLLDPQLEEHLNSLIQMGCQKPKKLIPRKGGFKKQKSLLCKNIKVLGDVCDSIKDNPLLVQEINEKVEELTQAIRNALGQDNILSIEQSPVKKKEKKKDNNVVMGYSIDSLGS